ncbi:MAG: DUF167 domain-containing protein [Planctomycetes bacterium]|nr:DUF167 domain-containing protein [Planctomycetota bacterium]
MIPADSVSKLNIESRERGAVVVFGVKARPRARRHGIVGLWNGCLRVAVREPAEDGRANDAIIRVLAEALILKKSSIQICSGATSQRKTFSAAGIAVDLARQRLLAALPEEAGS